MRLFAFHSSLWLLDRENVGSNACAKKFNAADANPHEHSARSFFSLDLLAVCPFLLRGKSRALSAWSSAIGAIPVI